MNREDRKKQLIAQGAVYRAEVLLATEEAKNSLRPDSLARSALQQAALFAVTLFRSRGMAGVPGINLKTLLPLVATSVSALAQRKSLLRTLLGGGAVAAAAGVAAFAWTKKKRGQAQADETPS
ncbi:MAG TPA: hypothetical protein VEC01_05500 [Noviherbaspirillum sp.]|uniref:hypothetical protein n=1 Tax=Noviherbaspirillum sp. TaxID=1926288 RepID=UPI002D2C855A|nr:hypothetical protein [Noviherbaspirillum sp.]HYD94761.1 hypothetical protein [Noviherbaspirillum sp.]